MFSSSSSQASSNLGIQNVFNAYTYAGTGSTPTFISTPVFLNPVGFEWFKSRNNTSIPHTFGGTGGGIYTNSTDLPFLTPNYISGTSGNFVLFGSLDSYRDFNYYVVYSTLPTPKFYSQLSWTGNGSARTIPHSLGSAPGMVIIKSTSGTTTDWYVWHRGLTASQSVFFNTTAAVSTTSLFSSVPDANNLYLSGSLQNLVGSTYSCYMWAHDAGGFGFDGAQNIVSCGTYTGNGSTTTGLNVSVGYEPQWILVRNITTGGNWFLADVSRGASETQSYLASPNVATGVNNIDALSASASLYPTQTGFTAVNNASWLINASGDTYIYMTIRRGPMVPPTNSSEVFTPVISNAATGTSMFVGLQTDMQMSRIRNAVSNTSVVDSYRGAIETIEGAYAGSQVVLTNSSVAQSLGDYTNGWQTTEQAVPSPYNNASAVYWNFKRAPRFFDIVRFTGGSTPGTGATVNHSLGYTPEMMWVKRTDGTGDFTVYHSSLPAPSDSAMFLNSTGLALTSADYWNSNVPTSTVFYTGGDVNTGYLGYSYIAYLFATVPGVTKVGSYISSGASQDIDCGFGLTTIRFLIVKNTNTVGNWYVYDVARGISLYAGGAQTKEMTLNSTDPEFATSVNYLKRSQGGFRLNGASVINSFTATYIFYAIGGETTV